MKKLMGILSDRLEDGRDAVLVTVVASSGSAPRGAGAHMLVDESGRCAGTIGGGAVEYRALELAREVLANRGGREKQFILRTNQVEDLGMVCGGEVTVRFQYLSGEDTQTRQAAALAGEAFHEGRPCWLVLGPDSDRLTVCTRETLAEAELPEEVKASCGRKPALTGGWYTEPLLRNGWVYIFGGGHVAQALVPILASVEFRCVVLEDRPEFCRPELFPGAEETVLIQPEEWEQKLHLTEDDFICIMTRGHKNDTDCEAFALRTPASYIGVIGSRRKIAAVNARLKERGFTDEDLTRITTPIGLPILAETPAEIAVSIAAQMIMVRAEQ